MDNMWAASRHHVGSLFSLVDTGYLWSTLGAPFGCFLTAIMSVMMKHRLTALPVALQQHLCHNSVGQTHHTPTPPTQYGLLTLVNQEPHVAALQVKNAAGQWITAHPIPGAFVCNIGDMLRVLTNDRYMPTAHRVINADPEQDRVSIPFFYEPNFDAEVGRDGCGHDPGQKTRFRVHRSRQ